MDYSFGKEPRKFSPKKSFNDIKEAVVMSKANRIGRHSRCRRLTPDLCGFENRSGICLEVVKYEKLQST